MLSIIVLSVTHSFTKVKLFKLKFSRLGDAKFLFLNLR